MEILLLIAIVGISLMAVWFVLGPVIMPTLTSIFTIF